MAKRRIASVERNTKETRIKLALDLDGSGKTDISTGIPFFDHMLELFAHHGMIDLEIKAEGDISVDYHHTVEDVGIVLGQAVRDALGNKAGIKRYGFFLLPMDECLSRFVMDLGNRPHLVYRVSSTLGMVRDFNIVLVREFFQAFANTAGANVHIELLYGDEPHHIAESIFKGFGRALDACTELDPRREGQVPSTKGSLG
jgi:imidazoleglycerol-phosphate dehydratase